MGWINEVFKSATTGGALATPLLSFKPLIKIFKEVDSA
jgi:hypothetical protein